MLASDQATCSGQHRERLNDNERRGFELLGQVPPHVRQNMFRLLFDHMRQGLSIAVDALDQNELEAVAMKSRQVLKDPWAIGQEEQNHDLNYQTTLVIGTQGSKADRIVRVSGRSVIARRIAKEAGEIALADIEPLVEARRNRTHQPAIWPELTASGRSDC